MKIYDYLKGTACIFTRDGKEFLRYSESMDYRNTRIVVKEITEPMRKLTFDIKTDEYIDDNIKKFHKSGKAYDTKVGIQYSIPLLDYKYHSPSFFNEIYAEKLLNSILLRCLADSLQPVSPIFWGKLIQDNCDYITFRAVCYVKHVYV